MDAQTDAEKIRNKRLAKLGTAGTVPQADPSSSSTPHSVTPPNAHTATGPTPETTDPIPSNAPDAQKPKINITQRPPQAPPKSSPRPVDHSIEAWTDRTLGAIFRITLDPNFKPSDHNGLRRYFLKEVKADLEESNSPLQLTTEVLDPAIIEAASHTGNKKPLSYLLGCWKRVVKLWRDFRGTKDDAKIAVLKEAKRLCMSYCIFATTLPDMFGVTPSDRNPLAEHLLKDPDSDHGICHEFLSEAISRFEEDDSIKEALVGAVEQMSMDLSKETMNGPFKTYVGALRTLVRYQPLVVALSASSRFLPSDLAPELIETQSLLGPFFALSPLHPDVSLSYFAGSQAQGESHVISNQDAVRLTLRTLQDDLFEITNCFVKAGKEPRERLLDWFALIVNKNHKRRATYVDAKTVSSDGFMINITTTLDRLCEPFMDATFSKVDRIDVDYLRRHPRVDISDETKINADQQTSDEFYASKAEGTNNFISEIFFLTVAAHHYGSEAVTSRLKQLERNLKHFEKEVEKMESERPKFSRSAAQLAMFEQHLKRFKDQVEKTRCVIQAIKGVQLDELTQQRSMQLMRYIIVWLMRIVQPGTNYPTQQLSLPLPEEQPLVFRCLPEYFVEDIVDNFKFITSHMPQVVPTTQCDELITICVAFLRNSEYIKNPYLKSGLISILFHGVWAFRARAKGIFGDLLIGSPFCHKHLLHALMKFYIEAETTGTHNQFYDKFNIRYEIFQVIRCVWSNPVYRNNLNVESKTNPAFFIRFVNLLLNDVTYVLGESFAAFTKMNTLKAELASSESLTPEQKQEKQDALEETKHRAKANMQLTNETMSMLKLFTEVLAEAFTMPEIVQRLADMLDYNLAAMVGPQQMNLKVDDPQSYYFNPAALLSDFMSVYTNLKDQPTFLTAVARDGRSYSERILRHAAVLIQKSKTYKSKEELETWTKLVDDLVAIKTELDQADEDLGDIPDEFQDPILAILMEDPVILPTSKNIVDRSTIQTHLLSDAHDPFNRQPLKIEDVIPDVDLKQRIQEFKAEARRKRAEERAAATAPVMDEDQMDTT